MDEATWTTAVVPAWTWRRRTAAWDVAVAVAAAVRTTVGDVAAAAAAGGWKGDPGQPLRRRPWVGHHGRGLCAARDGRRHVVAHEAVGGGREEGYRCGRAPVAAVEVIASAEVAVPTATSDVAADEAVGGGGGEQGLSLQTRPWGDRGGRRFRRCGSAGTGAGDVASNGGAYGMAALLPRRATPRGVLAVVAENLP